jgi:elongator complex protein 3
MVMRKPTRTISGVTPLAVMLKPRSCRHGACVFCPSLGVPQSYTPKSPAVMRALLLKYDPYKQVRARMQAFEAMGHPTDKIELIIMGGTFLDYPLGYQYEFVKRCYDGMNGQDAKNLEAAKKLNEKARHRCVALCIETRPDVCGEKEIKRMLEFGATRCELGVQAPDDKIYKLVKRGHTVADIVTATRLLKDSGFKVGYHIMPGIPGSNLKKDIIMFKMLFSSEKFKPDQLKIYPCQVIKGAELESWLENERYFPYDEKILAKLLAKMILLTPEYCRIMRIMREIPPEYIAAGIRRIDLRKDVEAELRKSVKDMKNVKEIRMREIGFAARRNQPVDTHLKLKTISYKASGGKEYFISVVNKDNILFGLVRLRIPGKDNSFLPELKGAAIVRELHVYGPTANIGERREDFWQHKGLGKLLMKEAEKLAKKAKKAKIAVISGVGVREYYRQLGYKLDGSFMSKRL